MTSRLGTDLALDGAPQALQRAASCTQRQLLVSAALTAVAIATGLELRAYTWLALFAALLLPLGALAGLLVLIQRVSAYARTWLALWGCLLLLLPASAVTAGILYVAFLSSIGIDALNQAQIALVESLLCMLLLVLPLWVAQQRARTLHMAQLS